MQKAQGVTREGKQKQGKTWETQTKLGTASHAGLASLASRGKKIRETEVQPEKARDRFARGAPFARLPQRKQQHKSASSREKQHKATTNRKNTKRIADSPSIKPIDARNAMLNLLKTGPAPLDKEFLVKPLSCNSLLSLLQTAFNKEFPCYRAKRPFPPRSLRPSLTRIFLVKPLENWPVLPLTRNSLLSP